MDQTRSKDFERDYDHHPPLSNADEDAHAAVRSHVEQCARQLNLIAPPSRELSLAHTKLEEAMFWANAALARKRYDDSGEAA